MGRSDDLKERIRTFADNLYDIEDHNSKHLAYNRTLNSFSHLTIDELHQQKLGYVPATEESAIKLPAPNSGRNGRLSVPDSFDWRNQGGVVRPVQDQAQCGSCWAFAAIGAIEGQMSLWKWRDDKLSEQEVIDCVKKNGVLKGCGGGNDQGVYTHAQENKGVTTRDSNPYLAKATGVCKVGLKRAEGSQVSGFYQVPNDEKSVKEWLGSYGPLYTIFYVADDLYSYSSGVYTDAKNQCAGKSYNHAVLLVGYGTENGIDYWIVKNSWGRK